MITTRYIKNHDPDLILIQKRQNSNSTQNNYYRKIIPFIEILIVQAGCEESQKVITDA